MILGVGTDLCDIRRIERTLERFGTRFTGKVFTESEQARAERRVNPAAGYAQRFAAKEACAKALGTGFRQGVWFKNMVVLSHPTGQPYLTLTGGARQRLLEMVPPDMEPRVDLSLTDEYPLAQAVVVLSAVPIGTPQVPLPGSTGEGA